MPVSPVLAALRTRILALDGVSAVGDRVYPVHAADVEQPEYPCITLFHMRGKRGVWMPRVNDPSVVLVQEYSKMDAQEAFDLYEIVSEGLHDQKTLTSGGGVCFHEIRELDMKGPIWIAKNSVWQTSHWFLYRSSTAG